MQQDGSARCDARVPDEKPKSDGLKLPMITQPQGRSAAHRDETIERDLRTGGSSDHVIIGDVGFQAPYSDAPPRTGASLDYREEVQAQGITGLRIVARIVDHVIIWVFSYVVVLPLQLSLFLTGRFEDLQPVTGPDGTSQLPDNFLATLFMIWGVTMIIFFILEILYFVVLEYRYQKTGGKKAFDMLVLDNSGRRANWQQLLGRAAIYAFGMLTFLWIAELIVMLVRSDGRSLTDMICGTRVIRVKRLYYSG